jgi:hypothetical protein
MYRSDLCTCTCTRSPHGCRASRIPCARRPSVMTTNCWIQADDRVAAVRGAQCYHRLPPHALLRSRLAYQSQAAAAAARLLPVVKLAPFSVLVAALACWSRDALYTRVGRVGQIGRIDEISIRLTSFGHQKRTVQEYDALGALKVGIPLAGVRNGKEVAGWLARFLSSLVPMASQPALMFLINSPASHVWLMVIVVRPRPIRLREFSYCLSLLRFHTMAVENFLRYAS